MCDQNRKDDQQRTPLVDALHKQLGRVSFHMPGHRQGRIFPRLQADAALALDTTELDRTGDLAQAEGHVQEAYQLAARFFGAGRTWFITSGTTTSIFIMMATALREGDKVILPRALHLAAVHAVAILGLEPIFVSPRQGQVFPDGQPDEAAYLETIHQHPQARACLVTRPDYYGRTLDLRPLAQVCHQSDMALLVDEAHGAHFAAAPGLLPETALSQGADMTCQSGHKTLPALTPASLLHLSQDALDRGLLDLQRLAGMVKVFQTSSPSFLVAASLDEARSALATRGPAAIRRLIQLNQALADQLPEGYQRILPPGADPARLVLDYSRTGLSRQAFARALDQAGIDAELVDLTRLVLIPGLDQDQADYDRLALALQTIGQGGEGTDLEEHLALLQARTRERDRFLSAPAAFLTSPRQALLGRIEGQRPVLRAALAPYPPGLPLLWPGEEMTPDHRAYLDNLQSQGIHVRGLEEALL